MLFEPLTLKGLTLPNRFVRSATCDWMADASGHVTDPQVDFYSRLSRGGIGMIVSGHIFARDDGVASPGMLGASSDDHVDGLRRLAEAVHTNGDAKLFGQINHGGRSAVMCFEGGDIVAPSAVKLKEDAPVPRALETDEVGELAASYGEAARRVMAAGFDGVQIHGAHGYLVSQFLSPLTNTREDEFGGSLENRARFLRLIVGEMRERVGTQCPVAIKLGVSDGEAGGLTFEEGTRVGSWLEQWGVDAIEVSGGIGAGNSPRGIVAGKNEGPFLDAARGMKRTVSVPVIAVNGFRTKDLMERTLREGEADLIAMCRPFIREPALVRSLQSGETSVAACVSCNGCFGTHASALRCVRADR